MTKRELIDTLLRQHKQAKRRQRTNKRYDAQLRAQGAAKAFRTAMETVELLDEMPRK